MRVRAVVTTLGLDAGQVANVKDKDPRVEVALSMGLLEALEAPESVPFAETTQESPSDVPAAVEASEGPLPSSKKQESSDAA